MNVERINPEQLARPSGFSHAVSASAARTVYLAGQIGMDRDSNVVGGGIVAQFEQALGNMLIALAAAGGQPEDLVSLTIYLIDVEDYQAHGKEIGAVWRRLAGTAVSGHGGRGRDSAVGPGGAGRDPGHRRGHSSLTVRFTYACAGSSSRARKAKNRSAARMPTHPSGSSSAGRPGSR